MNTESERIFAEAYAHYQANRWDEAGSALERALESDPSKARAWYYLGNVRAEQQRDPEALACFERAVALDRSHAQSWNNLGTVRQRLGRLDEAAAAYRHALECEPTLLQPYLNLGRISEVHADMESAQTYYRAGLAHHPGNETLRHLLAAAAGVNPERAPAAHVAELFDDFAGRFDEHLLRQLDYRLPEQLPALVRPYLGEPFPARVLDLGCGTGLCGAAIAGQGIEIIGVDLSARMVELAAKRDVYSRLIVGDLDEAFTQIDPGSCRLVIAADVFPYVGDLASVFQGVARMLAPGGGFVLSFETLEDGQYRLQPSGRYSHSVEYVRAVSARSGLTERSATAVRVRKERDGYAAGYLVLLERQGV